MWSATLAGLFAAFPVILNSKAVAQERPQLKRPEETPPERPPEKKKPKNGKEPRAVGILQQSGGKWTLIPVAILIDGKFYDASLYKADPVPMALESGTVYEAEQSGDSQGLFTVGGALHSKNAASPTPWIATGSFLPQGAEAPKSTRKAEDVPVGLDNSGDEPPRLTRKSGSSASPPSSGSKDAPSAGGSTDKAGASSPMPSQPAAGNSPGTAGGTSGGSGQQVPKPGGSAPSDKPADPSAKQTPTAADAGQKSGQATSGQSSSGESSTGESSDSYYRPTLRRGKPTQVAPDEPDEAVTKKIAKADGTTPAAEAGDAKSAVRTIPAISDAAGPEPRSYGYFWKTGEESDRLKQMMTLAGNLVQAHVQALIRNQIPATPVAPKATGARKAPSKPAQPKLAQPVFENVQFHGFDLWLTNQLVMVFSGEARIPGAKDIAATAEPYDILLVARTDIYGNPVKLYSEVSDKFHLDVAPRLDFVDVVDADGDGRGELLVHETSDAGSGYLIYRATADKLWKMFDSLNPE